MNPRNIAVLFGGCSPEYGVSLQSAYAVLCHMDRSAYTPIPIGISPEGSWFRFDGDLSRIPADTWQNAADCTPAAIAPDRGARALLTFRDGRVAQTRLDAAFPVLHGRNGEDGTVQGAIELAGIPLVGCGVLASALCMDKDRAHRLVRAAGLRTPEAFVLDRASAPAQAADAARRLAAPLFVKPVRAGSSYGITKVKDASELAGAIALAFDFDDQVLLEEAIEGFEVGCAVLGNDALSVGLPDEIELSQGFFDFTEKYTLQTSAIHVPARVSAAKIAEIQAAAKRVYRTLGCRGFARVDLFLTPAGELVFNEVNTIPGFTAHSRFPTMLAKAGLGFAQVVSAVIELAVAP